MLQRLDIVTLGLLAQHPHTGYDVRKWLDRYGWALGYTARTSQIYRQLGRLLERGWVDSTPDPRRSGPDAKLYALTERGRITFEEWVDSPYEPAERPMDPDFQVRMFFSRSRGPGALLELVRIEQRFRRAQHDRRLSIDHDSVSPGVDSAEVAWNREVNLLLDGRGRLLGANLLAWLEAAEARLELLASGAFSPSAAPPTHDPDPRRIPTPEGTDR
ncbi:PadR family transcriptional regulator [Planctomonas psychrotolerans]|uniref:PadR family transcriptional regulator n=1 Tax=Planctomonas psychrotolerans TaxID=2528712 RepID=UPI00123A8F7A|nr:PadR family transcriptional regulator [Planctomonas psychrotolerans]